MEPLRQDSCSSKTSNSLADDPELIADFVFESREHLSGVENLLVALGQNAQDDEAIHTIFRAFHTIKGLAGFLEFPRMQAVSHEIETLLDLARESKLRITPDVIDVILQSADYLNREILRVENGDREDAAAPGLCGELVARIRTLYETRPAAAAEPALTGLPALDRPSGAERRSQAGANAVEAHVKVGTAKLDYLVEMVGEMVIAQSLVRHNPAIAAAGDAQLLRNFSRLARVTQEVQKSVMSMRMIPVRPLFQKMARLARDLSRKAGKQVELETSGEETELDRNMVEELADPLMHMVRNAIDHGIGTAGERMAESKPAAGRIVLRARHDSGHIVIEVADDGRGLDRARIMATAIEKGLIDGGAALGDADLFNLIFEPGFSTAERITDMSGRGVGMDVVKKQIQKLRGRVEIQSPPGRGTTFLLKLPLTLGIIDGFILGVGSERYIVPLFAIREMIRPARGTITAVENVAEVALVRDRLLPIIRLHRLFGVTPRSGDPYESLLVVCESEGQRFCLMVDEFLGKQEVVIKSMGEVFKNIACVAGSAILGDGRVSLILDIGGVMRSAPGRSASSA